METCPSCGGSGKANPKSGMKEGNKCPICHGSSSVDVGVTTVRTQAMLHTTGPRGCSPVPVGQGVCDPGNEPGHEAW